ncbi:hypothetical protein [Leifsonia poae]|uniref:hypothetical protein n=1 Tax=Leifsonia poae TaxID=110933 RepID=UPI001CBEF924|nr:hypothetical protein [Leifsonia poae]
MEDLSEIIGDDKVLELTFSSRYGQLETELWHATFKRWDLGDDEDGSETVLATARLARVNLHGEWLDSLDAESGSLEAAGGAFLDRDRVAEVDEDSLFAESLVIIDFVEVLEEHRGSRVSHDFVRGIGRIFRSDIVALIPASISHDDSDELVVDIVKFEGLRRHWERAGFVRVPDTDVMMLPFGKR